MRILIIEDERHLAKILKKGLEENGFIVDMCHDGEEGLYMAETYPFDAILLDILLPRMDGLTILNLALNETQPGTLPSRLVSAFTSG